MSCTLIIGRESSQLTPTCLGLSGGGYGIHKPISVLLSMKVPQRVHTPIEVLQQLQDIC